MSPGWLHGGCTDVTRPWSSQLGRLAELSPQTGRAGHIPTPARPTAGAAGCKAKWRSLGGQHAGSPRWPLPQSADTRGLSSLTSGRAGQRPGCVCVLRGGTDRVPMRTTFTWRASQSAGWGAASSGQASCGPGSVSSSTEGRPPGWVVNTPRGGCSFGPWPWASSLQKRGQSVAGHARGARCS